MLDTAGIKKFAIEAVIAVGLVAVVICMYVITKAKFAVQPTEISAFVANEAIDSCAHAGGLRSFHVEYDDLHSEPPTVVAICDSERLNPKVDIIVTKIFHTKDPNVSK